ncbi:fumarylacetoacetate hydrolase family protein [Robertmurraya kyonggiensis]|uniref:Fumarylacetoacetate hydrolase family protein n=1 Tax=Robertmurraya kyonggiensis TaxID=1037680 RepID=A0A4U1D6L2_9BACI|nr:fumarylacetoacetate hydrolase family protein [Robertmurraya kyonggiensis]TKC18235.1 fumarylacetoacetate hydrolase family protein [Robertmurraya kyonggiensis]
MKYVTAEDHHGEFVGIIGEETDSLLPLKRAEEAWKGESSLPETLQECIALEGFSVQAQDILQWSVSNAPNLFLNLNDVKLLAPIPRPAKNIFCVGKNYEEHAIEMGSKDDIPEHVMVFTKAPTTVIGPNETVLNHKNVTEQLDYEGELAVVIGKKGRGIKREEALDYIFGYTIVNDVTARDLQSRHKQFFIGKSLDASCPMGPWIVHSSVIENPNELNIETRINDEVRQSSNTKHFIFPIEEVISVLSAGMTLEPGDIIATGTPAGVGKGFKPPRFLKSGDKMEVFIEKIGKLVNDIEE